MLDGEPIESLVLIEGSDDPIAIGPDFAEVVDVDAVCVGVARGVEPITRAMLTPFWRGHEVIDELFIGIRRLVREERLDHFRFRWKTREIERKAARQGAAVGFGRGVEA